LHVNPCTEGQFDEHLKVNTPHLAEFKDEDEFKNLLEQVGGDNLEEPQAEWSSLW
jgi:hypothetical protein